MSEVKSAGKPEVKSATTTNGKHARTEAAGAGDGPSPHKKAKVETADGKVGAVAATPNESMLAQNAADAVAAAAKAAGPGVFVDPNLELGKMPGWYKDWKKNAELVFTVDQVGARAGKVKAAFVYKGSKKAYQFLTPAHMLATPHGPPYGDMTNKPMVDKMEATSKSAASKYIPGTPIGLNHRLDVPTAAWDSNLQTPEGEDPYCKDFVDVWLKEITEEVVNFVYDDVTTLKPSPDLFEKIKAEWSDRWEPSAGGLSKPDFVRNECLRTMMKGRPLYIPVNKDTKEKILKNRRVQLVAPVTKEQDKNKLKRTPPMLTTDPIMNLIYQHGHEYILYPIREAYSKKKLLTHEERKFNRGDVTAEYFTITIVIHKDGSPPRYSIRFNWKSSIVFRRSEFKSDDQKLDENLKDVDFSSFVIKPTVADGAVVPTKTPGGAAPTSTALVMDVGKEGEQVGGGFSEGTDDQE